MASTPDDQIQTTSQALRIADDLDLPVETVTEAIGIIGIRGSGKTTTGRVLTEELTAARQPVIVIDPLGVWYGLRSDRDGNPSGLPIAILGGDQGDLALPETAGDRLAGVVTASPVSMVLDLSLMRKGAQRRFMTTFVDGLVHANRSPLHVVVDECDLFIPQRPFKGAERLVGAMEDLVRRGRARGLGVTLISQRPASINKDVLSQVSVLVAHRLTGPQDRKAVDTWVEANGTLEQRAEMMSTLGTLDRGQAWVWSPYFLDVFTTARIRRPDTFDSSSTPAPGTTRPLAKLTEIDVASLAASLDDDPTEDTPTSETAPTDLTAALRAQITDLKGQLAAAVARPPVTVEVPVIDPLLAVELRALLTSIEADVAAVTAAFADIETRVGHGTNGSQPPPTTGIGPGARQPNPEPVNASHLPRGAQAMLRRAAEAHPMRLTWTQLATLAGLSSTSGTFNSYRSNLRAAGYLIDGDDGGDTVAISPAGIAVSGHTPAAAPVTAPEIRAMWRSRLPSGAQRMFDALVAAYPHPLTRQELGDAARITPTSGTFGSYVGTLRRNGLAVTDRDQVTATDVVALGPHVATTDT